MLRFATTNEGKVREAREYLEGVVDAVEPWDYDYPELQADDLEPIALAGARDAFDAGDGSPVIVEDAGLFVDGLGGFPGPYSSYAYATLGNAGLWRLAEPLEDRAAGFRSVVAYADGETARAFEVRGRARRRAHRAEGRPVRSVPYARGSRSGPGYSPPTTTSYIDAGSKSRTNAAGCLTLVSTRDLMAVPAFAVSSPSSSDRTWTASP